MASEQLETIIETLRARPLQDLGFEERARIFLAALKIELESLSGLCFKDFRGQIKGLVFGEGEVLELGQLQYLRRQRHQLVVI